MRTYRFVIRNGALQEECPDNDLDFCFDLESRERAVALALAINSSGMFHEPPYSESFQARKTSGEWYVDWIFEEFGDETTGSTSLERFHDNEWDDE